MGDADPMIGRTLHGTIEIRRKIGSGGMGNVYEGFQDHLGRAVAVKVMTPEHARNPIAAEYFLREARSASQLRHPNIIQIIDYGQEDDATIFIAMEYVPGRPLSRIIGNEFPLERQRIIEILDQTLAALCEAHRKQVVHRDLKPDNLMIEQIDGTDFVKVLDFGIAQSKAPERKVGPLTQQGAVVGTPQYMSPEQARGDSVDKRSDLFSLGIILYEMLTQSPPFDGESLPEILISVMKDEPPPPSALRPEADIDPALEAICLRAMKKQPDLRYQTAEDFREALKALTEPEKPAEPAAPAQFIFKRARSRTGQKSLPSESTPGTEGIESLDTIATGTEHRRPDSDIPAPKTEQLNRPSQPETPGLGFDVEELRGDLLGERAIVTALVVHQRSHRRVDSEEMAELRGRIDEVFEESARRWDARIHSRQGGFVTLLFGIPTPKPDDSFRAVQAALALRAELESRAPEGTAFGFGVSHGEVFCPSQDLARAAGGPLDDATEGARVAGDDNIVAIGSELQVRLETMFQLGQLDDEGHRPILGVLHADKLRAEEDKQERGLELVGRDSEIAALLGASGRLSKGRGSTLAIVGEPGVGKSALLQEAVRVARQRGARPLVARWRGDETSAVRAVRVQWLYDVIRHMGYTARDAETAFRETGLEHEYARRLAAFVHDRLSDAFGSAGNPTRGTDEDARAERALHVAMRRLLRAMTRETPMIVVVDDISGFEGVIVDFVRRWAEIATQIPLVLAVAIRLRPGQAADDLPASAEQMALQPLDPASALAFLKVQLPSTLSKEVLTRLVKIGAGFPLHLEHLARWVRSRRDFDLDEAEEMLAASRDVGELLRMRLYELPKTTQNVAALLAALGHGTRGEVLIELASKNWKPEEALQNLLDAGLIEAEGTREAPRLHFRPPALRHVVYDRLSRKMRQRIHRRAAAYFEQLVQANRDHPYREDLVALARHRELSGDPEGAVAIWRDLAERSLQTFDHDSGRDFLGRAIEILREHDPDAVDRRCRLELQLVRATAATGRHDEALDRCRKLDTTDDLAPRLHAEVRLELARLWLADEDPELVGRIVRQALGELRKLHNDNPDDLELCGLLIVALQLAARVSEKQERLVTAAEHALEAASITERAGIDPLDNPWGPALVWETLNQLGRIRIQLGELGGARKMFELAMRVVTQTGDRRGAVAVRANMAALLEVEGSLDAAYQNITAALREARKLADPFTLAKLEYNRAQLLMRQHRVEMATEAFEASLSLAEDLDWREGIAMNVDRLERLRASVERSTDDRFLQPDKR